MLSGRSMLLGCLLIVLVLGLVAARAYTKSFDPDYGAMASWYKKRDIRTAPRIVRDGYNLVVNTNTTLGPDGNIKAPDGTPYVFGPLACTSCHFGAGLIPEAIPFFQVRDKYTPPGVYYRAGNVNREVAARINWCLMECANGQMLPEDSYPMRAMVAYMDWVAEGITDPNMIGKDNWQNIPGHTWPSFNTDVMAMQADPVRGERIYWENCNTCHGKDGPGRDEFRQGEGRARVPALWGDRSYTKAAQGMYSVPIISRGIKKYMPMGKANLTEQQALDVAGFINSQPRPEGLITETYFSAPDPATGIPNALFKPSFWAVGVEVPGDPFAFEQRLLGPWAPIETWQKQQRSLYMTGAAN